jgi:hypothetical protein
VTGELTMLDSIIPANLPPGAGAYLGYVNGAWPTYGAVAARFPGVPVLSMTVLPGGHAGGCDCEAGDLTITQVPGWVRTELDTGALLPVVYAGAANMRAVTAALAAAGIARTQVRLLSAHYGAGQHICGPGTCGYPQADGTQWTDTAAGNSGTRIDRSMLAADFFTRALPAPTLEDDMILINPVAGGEPTPLAIPNGATRLRFYCHADTVIRVDFFAVQPAVNLTLSYGSAVGVGTLGAEAAQVYRVSGDAPVACVATT